jgi:hypothetical protein
MHYVERSEIMANNLQIKVTAMLDPTSSKEKIQSQLDTLAKDLKLTVTVNIDDKILNTLNNFTKQFEKISEVAKNTGKVIQENIFPDGSRVKVTSYNGIVGEIQQIGEQAKKTKEETRQLISDIEQLGNVQRKVTNQNASGNLTGGNVNVGDKFNNTTYRYNQNEEVTSSRTVENLRQQEVEIEKIRQRMLELNNAGIITNASLSRMSTVLNGAQTEAELNRIAQVLNRVQDSSKIREQNVQLQQQLQLYQRQAEIQVNALRNNPRKMLTDDQQTALTNYLNNVRALNMQTPQLQQRMRQLGLDFREVSSQAYTMSNHAMTFGQAMQTAFEKFPIWMVASTAFFQTFNFFKDGIQYVNELNQALTQISIVTYQNQQQVAALGESYNKLAQQLGVTTLDIANESAELYRQGLTTDQVSERMKIITQYAKISSMDTKTATEIMTAAINSMGVSAQKASDVWSLLGDATATGKHMCPLAS